MNKLKKEMYRIGEQTLKIDWTWNKRIAATFLIDTFLVISGLKKRKLNPDYAAHKEIALILCVCAIMLFSAFCDWICIHAEVEDSME